MKRLLPLFLIFVLLVFAAPVSAHESLRVRLYGPTCTDRGWKVEVLNHLTHNVRVELVVIKGNRDHIVVPPGGYMGFRVPTAKVRSRVVVARPSVQNYRETGFGLLARGYATMADCAWAA